MFDLLSERGERIGAAQGYVLGDALGDILRDLRIRGVVYGHCRLRRPWGVSMPAERSARFHFVVAGLCWLRVGGAAPVLLQAGDAVLLPSGVAHSLSDEPDRPTVPLDELPRQRIGEKTYTLSAGGSGEESILACCTLDFKEPAVNPLLELMPSVLRIRRATISDPLIPALLDAMAEEVMGSRMGSATVLTRLADVVVTRMLRLWAETAAPEDGRGWLAAVRDPRIGRALSAFHRAPAGRWTVERMACAAGMSRSVFSDRFAAIVGTSPAHYMVRWRMRLASDWLAAERGTVAVVSARLGYESEAAFSRAFKRVTGAPPSAFRRRA